ncbi:MAG: methyltransferase [Acidobacteriota bacterium]|nr:methyltransferase [Acidobacteriota bacterium]
MNESNSDPARTAPEVQAIPPHAQVIQMAGGHVIARAIYALAELGIADHLRDGPRSADELAEVTKTHAPSLYRLLRYTAGLGFFVEDTEHRFSLTPLGAALQSDAPGHTRSTVRMLGGPVAWRAWGEFLHSVRTGDAAAEEALGQSLFDYLSTAPEEAKLFNETMIGFHGAEPEAVAAAYDFSGMGTLVDVGGGSGNLLTTILLANLGLKGVLYDLPHVAAEARRQIEMKGLSGRCEVTEGSFFESVPEGGDAYMLSHIIHDWDEQRCLQILENCRRAMRGRGRLLLVEMVIPPGNDFHPGKFLDLMMLVWTGGRERTEEEYAALFEKAGFALRRVVPTESPVSVVEAEPV